MDIILRPVPAGQDICLWVPTEVDDCTVVVGGGMPRGKRIQLSEDWRERQARQSKEDLLVVEILTHWLGRL